MKSKNVAMIFSVFLGIFGADRFYMGYSALGFAKLITLGGAGIWWMIDIIMIATDSLETKDGQNLI